MAKISNSKFKNGVHSSTGDVDSQTAGSTVGMSTVAMSRVRPGTLSALYVVDAETNTITLAAKWQVSADGSTWNDVANAPGNPAAVVLATGTGGADAAVTKAVPAPEAVSGWRFARASIVVGVTTGTSSDTYTVSYNYVAA